MQIIMGITVSRLPSGVHTLAIDDRAVGMVHRQKKGRRFCLDLPGIYWRAGIPNRDRGGSGRSAHPTLKEAVHTAYELSKMGWI